MNTITNIQVHRFGDAVAITLGDSETKYLRQKDAQDLVNYINLVITDIALFSFSSSQVGTYQAELNLSR